MLFHQWELEVTAFPAQWESRDPSSYLVFGLEQGYEAGWFLSGLPLMSVC